MTIRVHEISADTPLRDCPEGKLGLAVPLPISDRLDQLVAAAESAGEATNRKELVASLILAARPIGKDLADALRRYRLATAKDSRLDGRADEPTMSIERKRPGPRPRRRRSL